MAIPLHSHNPLGALQLMDYFFRPKVAAMVAEYVHYITPVPAAQPIIMKDAAVATGKQRVQFASAAHSPLVFPSKAAATRFHRYRNLSPSEQKTWDALFQPIYQS